MVTTQVPFQGKDVVMRLLVPFEESFDGDGSTVTFTVTKTPFGDGNRDGTVDETDITATVDGVAETPSTVDVNTGEVTLASAPAAGVGNVVISGYYEHEPIMASEVSVTEEVENIELDQLGTDEKIIAETSLTVEGTITLRKEDADMAKLFWGGDVFGAGRTKFILKLVQTRGATTDTYYYHETKLWTREESQTAGDLSEETFTFTAAGAKVISA